MEYRTEQNDYWLGPIRSFSVAVTYLRSRRPAVNRIFKIKFAIVQALV